MVSSILELTTQHGAIKGKSQTKTCDKLMTELAKKTTGVATMKATSFNRNAAAAASACGLDLHVVLPGTESVQNPLSQALFMQWGTMLHYEPEGELKESSTIKDFLIVRQEGTREVKCKQGFYNLDAIISVGYRIKSH